MESNGRKSKGKREVSKAEKSGKVKLRDTVFRTTRSAEIEAGNLLVSLYSM